MRHHGARGAAPPDAQGRHSRAIMKATASSLLFVLVSPFFQAGLPTSSSSCTAFLTPPSILSKFTTSSIFTTSTTARQYPIPSSPRRFTTSRSSSSLDGGSTDESSSGFSSGGLHRELNRRRAEQVMAAEAEQSSSSAAKGDGRAFMEEQMILRKTLLKAFVLVYNQGQPEEGVYTLFVEGRNVLRAWEDKPEAARYALMLRAEDLPLGKPTELPMSQIIGFCKENGVGLELVPRGRGLQPPSRNKPEFDFDCSGGQSSRSAGPSSSPKPLTGNDSLFTPQELARIKKQFEKSLEGGDDEP